MNRRLAGVWLACAFAFSGIAGTPPAAADLVDLGVPKTKGTIFPVSPRFIGIAQADTPTTPLDLFTGLSNPFFGSYVLEVGITGTPGGCAPVTIGNSTQDLSTSGQPNDLELADVNADGNIDAAVAHGDGVSLARGAPNGSYSSLALVGSSGVPTSGVALARLGAGARPDMIVSTGSAVVVYTNTNLANPPYVSGTAYVTDAGTTDVATGDLDGDGDQDIATAATSTQRAIVLPNEGGAPSTFTMRSAGLFTRPGAIAVADVSGDGRAELIVTEPDRGTVAVVSTANLPTSLGPIQRIETGFSPVDVATGDLDGNGRPEIVTANAGSDTVTVTEVGAASRSFPAGPSPSSVAIAEVTGDSRPDVVVANDATRGVSILANLGVPTPPVLPPSAQVPISIPAPPAPIRRNAGLSCSAKGKPGNVRRIVCTATLSSPGDAKILKATLQRKGSKRVLATATAQPGKKLMLSVKDVLSAGSYVVKLTVGNVDDTKLTDERGVKVLSP
ncbi:MAG TPA: FG-GAP-like repeat-containing protein [Solirubrobacterales bacterium]|nr:FG-GAP-like repeat-containing protein [Solirubrobacterales bacterium]